MNEELVLYNAFEYLFLAQTGKLYNLNCGCCALQCLFGFLVFFLHFKVTWPKDIQNKSTETFPRSMLEILHQNKKTNQEKLLFLSFKLQSDIFSPQAWLWRNVWFLWTLSRLDKRRHNCYRFIPVYWRERKRDRESTVICAGESN